MREILQRQKRLHDAWGIVTPARPTFPPLERLELRRRLLAEEAREADDAMWRATPPGCAGVFEAVAKELADVVVVTAGAALEYGIPLDRVLAEVMRANESKLGPDGRPLLRADGKVLKGPNYRPPDLRRALWGPR